MGTLSNMKRMECVHGWQKWTDREVSPVKTDGY